MASRLRINIKNRPRQFNGTFGPGSGQEDRLRRIQLVLTRLVREERVEGNYAHLHETRGYAEKLLQMAVQNGPVHASTMEAADFYLKEKDLVPKLFEVLATRYQDYSTSFTSLFRLPAEYPGTAYPQGMLELKGNPWPAMRAMKRDTRGLLTNVLLEEAKREWRSRMQELRLDEQLEQTTQDNS